ncbi:midnolin homolog [Wyeomyia smithii]|uniref:midnolin homolog n=1 Tax=Wyeomyia smithii TaxID=174621 RepID=UPI002467B315|nr:midnolin homolog [Wyeomyia smithii]
MEKSGGESREGGSSSIPSAGSSSAAAAGPVPGCGSSGGSALSSNPLTLNVTTTTGGNFSVIVDGENSVENLKKIISKKLKVSKDRICLLHRERELNDGTLRENGLMDGSKLILTPNVETGLLAQRAENTVMQALESLNDNQVNDFLSGKSPLNLSVRLGDHMMLIQLQLSTLNPASQSGSRSKAHKSRTAISAVSSGAPAPSGGSSTSLIPASPSRSSHSRTTIPIGFRRLTTAPDAVPAAARPIMEHVNEGQTLTKQEIESIHSIVKNLTESDNSTVATVTPASQDEMETDSPTKTSTSESPIKSLSNLVSSSINASIPPAANNNTISSGPPSPCADPISANLTSCLCRRLDNNDNNSCDPNCLIRTPEASSSSSQPSTSSTGLHRTAHNPIARHKAKIQTFRKYISFDGSATPPKPEQETLPATGSHSAPNSPHRLEHPQLHPHLQHGFHYQHQQRHLAGHLSSPVNPQPNSNISSSSSSHARLPNTDPNGVENPALAEASRNLTQTLRKLSKRVFTKNANDNTQESTGKSVSSGAVIESMKHHGKGIYSGTFSGTLNPALQDKFGRPKRDISTIIHILNDLLSAAPQCARSGTKIYFEPSQPASVASSIPGTSATITTSTSSSSSSSASSASSSGSGSGSGSSNGSSNNLQTAAVMAPPPTEVATSSTSFTTPIAAPSPRLVTRCVPTPIQTKKYPSSVTTVTYAGPSSVAGCISCKPLNPPNLSMTSSASYGRCHHHQKMTVSKTACKCGLPLTPTVSPSSPQCQRCMAISAAALENSKTKSKLDNLRLIMQQKKERREARKQKCAPYSTTLSAAAVSSAVVVTTSTNPTGGSGSTLEPACSSHRQLAAVATNTNTGAVAVETMDTTPPSSAVTVSESSKPRAAAAADITATAVEATTSSSSSSNNAATATATATTTTTSATAAATTAAATSSEAAQSSHQLVEEVDTVA